MISIPLVYSAECCSRAGADCTRLTTRINHRDDYCSALRIHHRRFTVITTRSALVFTYLRDVTPTRNPELHHPLGDVISDLFISVDCFIAFAFALWT